MATITIEEIQRDVKGTLQRVRAGESSVILEANEPVAEINPVEPQADRLRPYALCVGEFRVPDDFDVPLPDEIAVVQRACQTLLGLP